MPQYRVALAFAQLPDTALDDFAGAVVTGLTGNAAFPTPPVTVAQLSALQTAFENAIAATAQGGTTATAAKNDARDALVSALRKNAHYVEITADNDLPKILSSGYLTASTNRAQSTLDQVQIIGVDNGLSGQLKVRINPVANAKGFDGRIKSGNADYGAPISFPNSKSVLFTDLTPGTVYTMQVRAVGGSSGTGDWSDPTSHMAT